MRQTELLIPASSLEVLKVAVTYGADAVYIGGEMFGLRAKARNFTLAEMKEGIEYAHARGVKVFVTANIVARNEDLPGIREYFRELKELQQKINAFSLPGVQMAELSMGMTGDFEVAIEEGATLVRVGSAVFGRRQYP